MGGEFFEVFEVVGRDGGVLVDGGGGDHAIGSGATPSASLIEKLRCPCCLVLRKGDDVVVEKPERDVLLFFCAGAITKFKPCDG